LLNKFLVASDIAPVGKPWFDWSASSESTRQRYTKRAAEIVSAVLKVVSPDDAKTLWQALVNSTAMNAVLDVDELPQSEQSYLNALAEAYKNAVSWDTRRQVLSILSGIASYNIISKYIPGLTKYRFTMANSHRLQFGRGKPLPQKTSHRIKVDLKQLDHFLSFITSPHLVQDMPYGTKHLKLSSGEIIDVPNVIRTMIFLILRIK